MSDHSGHSDAAPDARAETARAVEDPYAPEVLDPTSCWAMLRANSVGRIAACLDGHPQIFPVTYAVDGESIVFRTASGTKLSATRDAEVAFEVDSYESSHGVAASVIVAGRAREIVDDEGWDHALSLPLFPWLAVPMGHFVRITPASVSGRRFRAPYAGARTR
jgi:hypothetical protein